MCSHNQKFSTNNSSSICKKEEGLKLGNSSNSKSLPNVPDYVRVLMVTDVNGRTKQLHVPAALDLERPKRPRTTFTERQVKVLELEFQDNHFVSEGKRQRLSSLLNLSQTQIKVWYQNRRSKCHRLGCFHEGNMTKRSNSVSCKFLGTLDERHISWGGTGIERFDLLPRDSEFSLPNRNRKDVLPPSAQVTMKTKEKLVAQTAHRFYPWSPELAQFPRLEIWSSSNFTCSSNSISQAKSVT